MIKVEYYASRAIPSDKANGVHVAKMGSALIECGVDYKLLCTRKGVVNIEGSVSDYYGLKNNIDSNIEYISQSNFKLLYNLTRSKLRGCDFVFTRSAKYAYLSTKLGIKTVYEVHAPLVSGSNEDIWMKKIVRSRYLASIIVITNSLRDRILKDYDRLSGDKIITFPDGSDIISLDEKISGSIKKVVHSHGYEINIGYTGTAGLGRGLDLIHLLAVSLPKVGFHLVGMTEEDFYKFVETSAEHRPENLIFHGFKSSSSIPYYIHNFDLMLAPYQKSVFITNKIGETNSTDTGKWMSPIKIFEYMASGTPFITSDLNVLREVLSGENTTLVNPVDLSQWTDAIFSFIENPEAFYKKAANAREDLEKKYTWEKRAKGIKEAIFQK